jgi:hypothetical protein
MVAAISINCWRGLGPISIPGIRTVPSLFYGQLTSRCLVDAGSWSPTIRFLSPVVRKLHTTSRCYTLSGPSLIVQPCNTLPSLPTLSAIFLLDSPPPHLPCSCLGGFIILSAHLPLKGQMSSQSLLAIAFGYLSFCKYTLLFLTCLVGEDCLILHTLWIRRYALAPFAVYPIHWL